MNALAFRCKRCIPWCSFCLIQVGDKSDAGVGFISVVVSFIRGILVFGLGALQGVHVEVPSDTTPVKHSLQTNSFDPSKLPLASHVRVTVDGEVMTP